MQKLLVAILIIGTVFSTFSVNLKKQKIDDVQNLNNATNISVKNADTVYTFKTKIQEKEHNVVFDVSVEENWVYQSSETPAVSGKTEVDAALGRATLLNGAQGTLEQLKFNSHDLKTVSYVNSNTAAPTSNVQFYKAAQAGFGLNRQYETNFFNDLLHNNIKIESEYRGFSFYFSQKVNQIFFGQPQEFFANQSLESVDAKTAHNAATWTVPVKSGGIELNGVDKLSYQDPTYATFDSTTKFIWASNDLVTSIVNKLNDSRFNCVDAKPDSPSGIYECEGNQDFPYLSITFKTMDNSDGKDSRKYHITNYTEKLQNGKVRLLIRKAAQYKVSQKAAFVPSTSISSSENQIILGTVFLENVYTYFSYNTHTVQMAQAFHVQPQRIGIDDTSRIWYLIVGSIFCVVIVGYLMSIMKSVPYDENANPISQAPAQQAQSQVRNVAYSQQPAFNAPQQQVVYQSYHQPTNQAYGQPQPYVVSQSPQRVVYQQPQYIQQ